VFPQQHQGLLAIRCKGSWIQAVVHVIAAALSDDEVGGAEDAQVLGDGGLRDSECEGQGVYAQGVPRLQIGQKFDEAQTCAVAKGPVDANEAVEFEGSVHKLMNIYLFSSPLSSVRIQMPLALPEGHTLSLSAAAKH